LPWLQSELKLKIVTQSNDVANINKLLKDVKFEISTNYIHSNNKRIVIMTNKIATSFSLNIVEKYMKELNNINLNNIMSLKFSQFKFYLKILDIPYFLEDTNLLVVLDIIERVIKSTYNFNNVVLTFCS